MNENDLIHKADLLRKFTYSPNGERYRLKDIDNFPTYVPLKDVQAEIRKTPIIPDAVPIVRCRECIHRNSRLDKDGKIWINCSLMDPDDFCKYGER